MLLAYLIINHILVSEPWHSLGALGRRAPGNHCRGSQDARDAHLAVELFRCDCFEDPDTHCARRLRESRTLASDNWGLSVLTKNLRVHSLRVDRVFEQQIWRLSSSGESPSSRPDEQPAEPRVGWAVRAPKRPGAERIYNRDIVILTAKALGSGRPDSQHRGGDIHGCNAVYTVYRPLCRIEDLFERGRR